MGASITFQHDGQYYLPVWGPVLPSSMGISITFQHGGQRLREGCQAAVDRKADLVYVTHLAILEKLAQNCFVVLWLCGKNYKAFLLAWFYMQCIVELSAAPSGVLPKY